MMTPCGPKHVSIFNVILTYEYKSKTHFFLSVADWLYTAH